jgi:hypothetical protein
VPAEASAAWAAGAPGATIGRNAVTATATAAVNRRRRRVLNGINEAITTLLRGCDRKTSLQRIRGEVSVA